MPGFSKEPSEMQDRSDTKLQKDFKLPNNIKQIGSIGQGIHIYLEDYVHTYLYQYGKSDSSKEKVAVLVGEYREWEGQNILLISGAIQGRYSKQEKGIEVFTDETWKYIDEKMKEYFHGLEIVGWMHTQPGYGVFLTTNDSVYHQEIFHKPFQVLYVMDPTEKTDMFFAWSPENESLEETEGYFIYYDRNDQMQEYMLDNRVIKMKISEAEENEEKEDVVVNFRKHDRIRRQDVHQKKLINMLSSLSAVLFLICLIMGVGLIQNGDRITKLETDLTLMDRTYKSLVSQIQGGAVDSAFAAQEEVKAVPALENESKAEVIEEKSGQEMKVEDTSSTGQDLKAEEIIVVDIAEEPEEEPEEPPLEAVSNPVQETNAEEHQETQQAEANLTIPETYTVKAGDNLNWISLQFYHTKDMVPKIMEFNGMEDPNKIFSGKVIKLPRP